MEDIRRSHRLNHAAPGENANSSLAPARSVTGPFPRLNSTTAHIPLTVFLEKDLPRGEAVFSWSSRNNRKGRHALRLTSSIADAPEAPLKTSNMHVILTNVGRMAAYFPVWDISYLVAIIFTLGSVIWVINAFFAFLPLLQAHTAFDGEALYGGGITAFIGATVFEIGSLLLMLEAINENRSACFGWAVEKAVKDGHAKLMPDKDHCEHHHRSKVHLLVGAGSAAEGAVFDGRSWAWLPSWSELKAHYIYELGFLACTAQLFGATVFWISGFTALPGIYNNLEIPGAVDGIFWTPQVVGGAGFIVSGVLFMVETQRKWYVPAPSIIGWHIGLWNLIGGVGFTLCPIFGYYSIASSWGAFQASCSTFWGSWAFLVGSVAQWYESLEKFPVEHV
ncbi:hypothetical protein FH972_021885 [Carpinus fangiana]|uniref:Integral membrane protein n=1 Tax=Carpinus fangiana TaxID=176857 RepID=A0A5N6KQM8_9ROSI|nr:hypothetical protein FH972_021885 [Carpinus fangiana]